jgi:hypothetical protein
MDEDYTDREKLEKYKSKVWLADVAFQVAHATNVDDRDEILDVHFTATIWKLTMLIKTFAVLEGDEQIDSLFECIKEAINVSDVN